MPGDKVGHLLGTGTLIRAVTPTLEAPPKFSRRASTRYERVAGSGVLATKEITPSVITLLPPLSPIATVTGCPICSQLTSFSDTWPTASNGATSKIVAQLVPAVTRSPTSTALRSMKP